MGAEMSAKAIIKQIAGVKTYAAVRNSIHNLGVFWRRLGKTPERSRLFIDNDAVEFNDTFYFDEIAGSNQLYGIGRILRNYAGIEKPIKACIEHGVYFGGTVFPSETVDSMLPAVITFGNVRRRHIQQCSDKEILTIGPYIEYANDYLSSEEFNIIKRKLGKTLLVFPMHSIPGSSTDFSYDNFCAEINIIGSKYSINSIVICLYYHDVERGAANYYLRKGYTVACAGHRFDPSFLPKLRSLIGLCDLSISNSVGTHVGYCVALGKPHYIIPMKTNLLFSAADRNIIAPSYGNKLYAEETAKVAEAFSSLEFEITKKQLAVVKDFWGLGLKLSSSELRGQLERLEEMMM